MSTPEKNPLEHPEVQQAGIFGYTTGFLCSLALLAGALLLTEGRLMPPVMLIGAISGLALIALLAQTFLSFGLDITRHNIWKSVSLILTIPLFILTIGLTVWMFQQLNLRVMPGSNVMPGMTMQPTLLQ